jgi:hypothetical protein
MFDLIWFEPLLSATTSSVKSFSPSGRRHLGHSVLFSKCEYVQSVLRDKNEVFEDIHSHDVKT